MRRVVISLALGLLGLATCGDDRYVLEQDRAIGGSLPSGSPVAEPAIDGPAVALDVSDRISPPPPEPPSTTTTVPIVAPDYVDTSMTGRCAGWESLLAQYPGWDVVRMSQILWRESKCQPWAVNQHTNDYGGLQVHWSNSYWTTPMKWGFGTLAQECEMTAVSDLLIPEVNIRCAHALYRAFGMGPWS